VGRPPIGKKPLSATERQRRWRNQLRQQPAAEPPPEPDRNAQPESPPPKPTTVPEPPAAKLIRERDEAWAERNALRRELEEVREQRDDALKASRRSANWLVIAPELVGALSVSWGDPQVLAPGPQAAQVEAMFEGPPQRRVYICSECVEEFSKIIAARRGSFARTPRWAHPAARRHGARDRHRARTAAVTRASRASRACCGSLPSWPPSTHPARRWTLPTCRAGEI
jgi:ClpX C4-type zinc finger